MMKFVLFIIIISIMSFQQLLCNDYKVNSGLYDVLCVGVNSNKLTAMYRNFTGWDERINAPRFSCEIFIESLLTNKTVRLISYYPGTDDKDVIGGNLIIESPNRIKLNFDQKHGGCWNVEERFDEEYALFTNTSVYNWIEIRIISSDKSYIYSKPNINSKLKSYFIKNDIIYVINKEPEWVNIEYKSGNNVKRGWIKESDLFKLKI